MTLPISVRTQRAFLFPLGCLAQSCPFSTSISRRAKPHAGPTYLTGQERAQPSNVVALRQASKNPPLDNGLLPGKAFLGFLLKDSGQADCVQEHLSCLQERRNLQFYASPRSV